MIDVQYGFWDNARRVQGELARALILALKNGDCLLVVELSSDHFGKTVLQMMEIVDEFPKDRVGFVHKSGDSGGSEIMKKCEIRGFPTEHLQVCGVNRCYCVFKTAVQLNDHASVSKVEVLDSAVSCNWLCNCRYHDNREHGIYEHYRAHGVLVNGTPL